MPATPAPPTGFTPVTLKQHGNRFWRRPRGYGFAAGWAHIPLCMAEVAHMAALLPLAFAPITPGGSRLGPVALCGPETAPPLCPETGAWRLPYVPAILRAYPFHVRQTAQQQLELWVYDSPETLSGVPTDQPFFGPDGQPAQQLEEVIGFYSSSMPPCTRPTWPVASYKPRVFSAPCSPVAGCTPMPQKGCGQ